MEQLSAREKARQAALSRSKATKQGPGKAEAQQGRANPQGNQLTFFGEDTAGWKISPTKVMLICLFYIGEDTAGWKISPTKVMLICLFYIGAVVVLHIFAKVKSGGSSAASDPKPEM